jgi:hypothetical protein
MNLESLVTDEMLTAAGDFVLLETGHVTSPDVARFSLRHQGPNFDPKIAWFFMTRAFLHGAIYQQLFGGKKVMGKTFIACVAHINESLEIGDSIIGSVHSVAEACSFDRNHPNAKGPFTSLARAFMAGAKWTTQN